MKTSTIIDIIKIFGSISALLFAGAYIVSKTPKRKTDVEKFQELKPPIVIFSQDYHTLILKGDSGQYYSFKNSDFQESIFQSYQVGDTLKK